MKKALKNTQQFQCEVCDFSCSKHHDYTRHTMTTKHKNRTNLNDLEHFYAEKAPKLFTCKHCTKEYKARNSLWYHEQKCTLGAPSASPPLNEDVAAGIGGGGGVGAANTDILAMQTTLILELVKQNKEFKDLLIQQSNQLFEQNKSMMDVAKNCSGGGGNNSHNNNHNHNNSHNKTFNLQFFLNETCKDAMNMKDFIESLELNLTDLEKVGELGYAEGISRMFLRGLNNLDITKRPIHCSDVKREIMHIKDDNKWEKDTASQDKLKNIIKQLTHKNIMMLDDWKQANPGCTAYDSRKYDHYLKLTMESMGPTDEVSEKRDFNKIIRRVAESTTIDKHHGQES
jgi:hypothetical protein